MKQPFFSICIPIWGAKGEGIEYLSHNLSSIANQTFTDFEVVISDHSIDDHLQEFVSRWNSILNIRYIKCIEGRGSISPNINNAIKHAQGKYIKILYQDDFFYDIDSLENIANYLNDNSNVNWLVTAGADTSDLINIVRIVVPKYHEAIYLGENTIGCPSILTIKNDESKLFFDETLKFLDDVEYYKRLYDKFGLPHILPVLCSGIRIGGVCATSLLTEERKNKEVMLLSNKYNTI
jgi:glycosyltransferase involved in cell wall biosynthesis